MIPSDANVSEGIFLGGRPEDQCWIFEFIHRNKKNTSGSWCFFLELVT